MPETKDTDDAERDNREIVWTGNGFTQSEIDIMLKMTLAERMEYARLKQAVGRGLGRSGYVKVY